MRYFFNSLLIGVAVIVLNSCDDDENVSPLTYSDYICFGGEAVSWNAPDVDAPRSRATETSPGDMGCYAFFNNKAEHTLIISNSKYVRNTSGVYSSNDVVYWPGSHATLDFYCYAPYGAAGLDFNSVYGSSSFSYTIPESQADRCDLLLTSAIGVDGGLNRAQALTFKHALTAVNIDVAENMGSVTIKDIKFTGVHCSGNATFDTDGNVKWDTDGDVAGEFSFAIGKQNYLMPQDLEGASMTVNMTRDGQDLSITAPLKTAAFPVWQPGTIVNYKLKIVPTFEIEVDAAIDAHYVLCPAKIHVDRMAADRGWTLTVSADDGAPVSVQHLADVNQYALQGFWTDKYMDNGVVTDESARGTNYITGKGNGDFDVMIFVPENAGNGNNERTITISITPDGEQTPIEHTIKQYSPDWDNGGWERIEDSEGGMYGFSYTSKPVYVYNFSTLTEDGQNRSVNAVNDLVAQYNAANYTTVQTYRFCSDRILGVKHWRWRFYVEIDYSKLNSLDGKSQSATNGYTNTIDLAVFGASGVTNTFEDALKKMRRRQDQSEYAFRNRTEQSRPANDPPTNENKDWDPDNVPLAEEGTNLRGSQALSFILKKNRYNINRVYNDEIITTAPKLDVADIVWYMPASGQFASFSPWIEGSSQPSQMWSSTAVAEENSDEPSALTGSGVMEARVMTLKVRACRVSPSQKAPYNSKRRTSAARPRR